MEDMRLGPYKIERELGSGGMGKVYAALVAAEVPGLKTGATVALKVVHPHLLETPGFFRRFMREADLGASIRHENVVRTHMADALVVDGAQQNFLVMEYVEGQTLDGLLTELGEVPEELCLHVAREVCKGLAAIHAAGVVHRDLKPENVLITESHVVKVMDLGVARLTDDEIRLSRPGAFVGSPHYASPEQFTGVDPDGRCDLHALGLVLYELATGQHPFAGGNMRQVMQRVCDETPRGVGEIRPQLSAFFEEVVRTLLQKDRDDRFANAVDLLAVLEEGEESNWWCEHARRTQTESGTALRRPHVPRETGIYGREEELGRLRTLFERARGGDGQVILIEGEAGIGKSRLVDELAARLQTDGESFRFLSGGFPPGGAATASGPFARAFAEHLGPAGSATVLQATSALVPAFDALLRGEALPGTAETLTKATLQTCFVGALRSIADQAVTVLLIDDLHFAPDEGRALFTSLAMAVPGSRVLLVGTTRPGPGSDWVSGLSRLPHTTQLTLDRLGPKDLAALLRESLGSDHLAGTLGMQIFEKSDGNPFFAFEILRGLREGQMLTQREDGTWTSMGTIADIRIPSSVLDLVNARVADLTEEERNILDVAACCGYEFDPLLVGAALELKQIPLMRALAHVEKKHRLVRSIGRRFAFDHHQVQEALYDAMPELLREPYHAALAEALQSRHGGTAEPGTLPGDVAVSISDHWLRAAQPAVAAPFARRAFAHLCDHHAPERAVHLAESVLSAEGVLSDAQRLSLLLALATINGPLDVLGRRARQETCLTEASELAVRLGDDDATAHVARAMGWCLSKSGRHAEALAAYETGLKAAQARAERAYEAATEGYIGSLHYNQGRIADSVAHYQRQLAIATELGDLPNETAATGGLAIAANRAGRRAEAVELAERYVELTRRSGRPRDESKALGSLANIYLDQGRRREARELYLRDLDLARRAGDRPGEATVIGNLASLYVQEGLPRRAIDACERSIALAEELGDVVGAAYSLHNLGVARRDMGDTEGAIAALERSTEIASEMSEVYVAAAGELALGSARAELAPEGGDALSRAALEQARELAIEHGFNGVRTLALCELALLPGGDLDAARRACGEFEASLSDEERLEARYLLWRATDDTEYLEAARAQQARRLDDAEPEDRARLIANVRIHRLIHEALSDCETRVDETVSAPRYEAAKNDDAEDETRVG